MDQIVQRAKAFPARNRRQTGFDQIGFRSRNRLTRPFQGQVCQLVEHPILHNWLRSRADALAKVTGTARIIKKYLDQPDFGELAFKNLCVERLHNKLIGTGS
jgi:hypothetical protein